MPKVIALKDFITPIHGNVQIGDVFNMKSAGIAQSMADAGLIKIVFEAQKSEPAPVQPEVTELTLDDIKNQLRELGVGFHPRTGKDKLLQLLKDAQDDNASEAANA